MHHTWGYLPEWPLLANPSTIMEGDPSSIILAEAALQARAGPASRCAPCPYVMNSFFIWRHFSMTCVSLALSSLTCSLLF